MSSHDLMDLLSKADRTGMRRDVLSEELRSANERIAGLQLEIDHIQKRVVDLPQEIEEANSAFTTIVQQASEIGVPEDLFLSTVSSRIALLMKLQTPVRSFTDRSSTTTASEGEKQAPRRRGRRSMAEIAAAAEAAGQAGPQPATNEQATPQHSDAVAEDETHLDETTGDDPVVETDASSEASDKPLDDASTSLHEPNGADEVATADEALIDVPEFLKASAEDEGTIGSEADFGLSADHVGIEDHSVTSDIEASNALDEFRSSEEDLIEAQPLEEAPLAPDELFEQAVTQAKAANADHIEFDMGESQFVIRFDFGDSAEVIHSGTSDEVSGFRYFIEDIFTSSITGNDDVIWHETKAFGSRTIFVLGLKVKKAAPEAVPEKAASSIVITPVASQAQAAVGQPLASVMPAPAKEMTALPSERSSYEAAHAPVPDIVDDHQAVSAFSSGSHDAEVPDWLSGTI